MSPKRTKFQNFKKRFKGALYKYIVVKFRNFTSSVHPTVSKMGALEICWSVCCIDNLEFYANIRQYLN